MENYTKWFKDKTFDCPLCAEELDIRISTKGKPYVVCDACGIQLFVRGGEGIKRLRKKVKSWL